MGERADWIQLIIRLISDLDTPALKCIHQFVLHMRR